MTKRFTPIWLVVLLLVVACGSDKHQLALLDSAETVMTTAPDTALALLDSIDSDRLSRADNARYALLRSQALDKNYIDVTNDSLINIAVKYYKKNKQNNVEALFLSYYYQGRVYENAQNSHKAMECYLMAEEIIDLFDNDYAKGLLYAHIGLIYNYTNDLSKSVEAYNRAVEFHKSGNLTFLQYNAMLSIGAIYVNMHRYDEALSLLRETLEWGITNDNSHIIYNSIIFLCDIYEQNNDIESLTTLHNSAYFQAYSNELWALLSQAYLAAYNGNIATANTYITKAWHCAQNENDTLNIIYKEYFLYKFSKDYQSALYKMNSLYQLQDSIVRCQLQHPLVTVQRDYYQSQAENRTLQLRNSQKNQLMLALLSLLILSALVIISIFYRNRIKRKNTELCNYVDMAQNLSKEIKSRNDDINSMAIRLENLFSYHYRLLNELSETYYMQKKTKHDKDAIYKQVKQKIEELSCSATYTTELEDIINEYKENVMAIARQRLINLKETDLRILSYSYAGFSTLTICGFTGFEVGNIYTRKSRIKSAINELDSETRELLLKHLN